MAVVDPPVPEDPVPEDPVPEDPVPEDPVPEDPVPEDPVPEDADRPRTIVTRLSTGDLIFRGILRAAAMAMLVITASILAFLVLRAIPTFRTEGLRFFTTSSWFISTNQYGIAAILPYSILVAVVALTVAIPTGIAAALFISEYAPPRLRRSLIAMIDLMAATPSIIVALFGFFFVMPRLLGVEAWLAHHLGFIPFFTFTLDNSPGNYATSPFIAGLLVSVLAIPIVCSLSRQVFSQAPQGEREAAYALGSTRWGMIRTVVLPYGRAGMVGASMLGLGRALGETVVVSFILTQVFHFNFNILQTGGNSVTLMIANHILDAGPKEISALMAAGMALFVLTIGVNTIAATIISRSRSGATASAD
jgi:phosphate transport system permease protein